MDTIETTATNITESKTMTKEQEELWVDFCDKSFKLGQLTMWIDQTKGKLADFEKQHQVALKNARGAADKYDQYLKTKGGLTPAQSTNASIDVTNKAEALQ